MKKIAGFIILVALGGCAAAGPVRSPEFGALVAQAAPPGSGTVLLSGPGIWEPNSRGFTGTRSALLSVGKAKPIPGVITIAEQSVIFSQWDKKSGAYVPIKRIALADVADVNLDKFGVARSLIIQRQDFSTDSFQFTRAGGQIVDGDKTEEAYSLLEAAVKKRP